MQSPPQGLVYCTHDWSNAFCITKTIEFCISLLVFLYILHYFIIKMFRQRQINFFFIVCLQMLIALLSNIIFTLDHHIRFLQYIQGYMYDVYFTTIVYQVSRKIILIKQSSKYYKLIFFSTHTVLILLLLILTVTFILRNIYTYYDCEESWFLALNIAEIGLSVVMVVAGKCHQKKQQKKIQGMEQKNIKNPLPNVWKWIIINIICQFSRFLRSFIYIIDPQNCAFTTVSFQVLQFLQDYTTNQILNLIFELFGFHVGMVSTIYFLKKKSNNESVPNTQFSVSIRDRLGSGYSKQIQMASTFNQNPLILVNQHKSNKEYLHNQNNNSNLNQQYILTVRAFLEQTNSQRQNFLQDYSKQVKFSI